MSFIKKTLRALGFGNDNDEEEHVYTAKDITYATGINTAGSADNKENPTSSTNKYNNTVNDENTPSNKPENNSPALPDALLDKVVELINASFPDFVRNCIDIESEKKYIYQQLGDSFSGYIDQLYNEARQQSENAIASSRRKLEEDVEALRRRASELEEQKNEIKNQQLSAERQKRALNEKVHDMDARIATLEAEKEQYDIENKSLINKLKVSGVKQEELDSANEEIKRLLQVVQELRKNTPSPQMEQELNEKKDLINTLQQQLDEKATAYNTLQHQFNEKETACNNLQQQLDEAGNRLNEASITQNKEWEGKLATLQNKLDAANEKIHTHLEKIEETTTQLDLCRKELTQHRADNNALSQENEKLTKENEQLAQARHQASQEYNNLNIENKRLAKQVESLTLDIDSLRQQLEQAANEKATQQPVAVDNEALDKAHAMIEALKQQRKELVSQTATLRSQNKTYENRITALENKLNNANTPASISFDNDDEMQSELDNFINWMVPVQPDSLEEEARRREEEERLQREEEEKQRLAEKERRAGRDETSSQMSLW